MRLTVRGGHPIPHPARRCHALLVDEERARRGLDRRSGRRAGPDACPGSACATTRRATSCATRCASATACCSITRPAPSRASPAWPQWRRRAYPDATQFDPTSPYHDPKSTRRHAALAARRRDAGAQDAAAVAAPRCAPHPSWPTMRVLQRGNRLSITPVTPDEWRAVQPLLGALTLPDRPAGWRPNSVALGLCTGFLAGLLGIGGGMMMVPFLTMHPDADAACRATWPSRWPSPPRWRRSCSPRCRALRAHHRRGAVRWDLVRGMAPGIVARRPGRRRRRVRARQGPRAGARASPLFVGFSATQMLRDRQPKPSRQMPGAAGQAAVGGGIGLLSGLVGAGGAFIAVPFMTWCNVPMHHAVATSAALGFPIALASTRRATSIGGWSLPTALPGAFGYLYLPALADRSRWPACCIAPLGARAAHALDVAQLQARCFALAAVCCWPATCCYRGLSARCSVAGLSRVEADAGQRHVIAAAAARLGQRAFAGRHAAPRWLCAVCGKLATPIDTLKPSSCAVEHDDLRRALAPQAFHARMRGGQPHARQQHARTAARRGGTTRPWHGCCRAAAGPWPRRCGPAAARAQFAAPRPAKGSSLDQHQRELAVLARRQVDLAPQLVLEVRPCVQTGGAVAQALVVQLAAQLSRWRAAAARAARARRATECPSGAAGLVGPDAAQPALAGLARATRHAQHGKVVARAGPFEAVLAAQRLRLRQRRLLGGTPGRGQRRVDQLGIGAAQHLRQPAGPGNGPSPR